MRIEAFLRDFYLKVLQGSSAAHNDNSVPTVDPQQLLTSLLKEAPPHLTAAGPLPEWQAAFQKILTTLFSGEHNRGPLLELLRELTLTLESARLPGGNRLTITPELLDQPEALAEALRQQADWAFPGTLRLTGRGSASERPDALLLLPDDFQRNAIRCLDVTGEIPDLIRSLVRASDLSLTVHREDSLAPAQPGPGPGDASIEQLLKIAQQHLLRESDDTTPALTRLQYLVRTHAAASNPSEAVSEGTVTPVGAQPTSILELPSQQERIALRLVQAALVKLILDHVAGNEPPSPSPLLQSIVLQLLDREQLSEQLRHEQPQKRILSKRAHDGREGPTPHAHFDQFSELSLRALAVIDRLLETPLTSSPTAAYTSAAERDSQHTMLFPIIVNGKPDEIALHIVGNPPPNEHSKQGRRGERPERLTIRCILPALGPTITELLVEKHVLSARIFVDTAEKQAFLQPLCTLLAERCKSLGYTGAHINAVLLPATVPEPSVTKPHDGVVA